MCFVVIWLPIFVLSLPPRRFFVWCFRMTQLLAVHCVCLFLAGFFYCYAFYLRALKYNWQRCSSIEGRVTCQLWIWPRAQWSWIASGGINGVITNSWRVDVTHSRPWASHAFFVITKQFLPFFFFGLMWCFCLAHVARSCFSPTFLNVSPENASSFALNEAY